MKVIISFLLLLLSLNTFSPKAKAETFAKTQAVKVQVQDTPELREKLAQEILEVTKAREGIEVSMKQSMDIALAQMPPEALEIARTLIDKVYTWEKMSPKFTAIYAETFTASELQDVINFYNTDVGRNFIAKQPEIMTKTMKMIVDLNQEALPELKKEFEKLSKKNSKEEAAK